MPFKVLFIGKTEDHSQREAIRSVSEEITLFAATHEAEALNLCGREMPQVVVIDFDRPDLLPLDFIRDLAEKSSGAVCLGLTRKNDWRLALTAVQAGFHDVINLIAEPGKLQSEMAKLIEAWRGRQKAEGFHALQKEKYDFSKIVGSSPALAEVLETLTKIMQHKWVTILLHGETGTGKELIARTIHYHSSAPALPERQAAQPRPHLEPFIEINCSAIPENLLEAELFGYEKGAFTDAKMRKRGLFELAENGTLFLDEIGDISLSAQIKLLKAVEEKKIRRLGGTEDIQINTRIIAATNRDLQAAIRDGRFRQDLYYRLNVIAIYLPPLRNRGDDVLMLSRHFLAHFAKEYASTLSAFTSEAEALLKEYSWPGNIRELQHTIERIVLLGKGQAVTRAALERAIESETPAITSRKAEATTINIEIPPEGMSFEEIEKQALQAVLEKMGWNKRRTCRLFKISRPRLARKIEKYQLKPLSEKGGNES